MNTPVERLEKPLAVLSEVLALRPWYHDFAPLGLRTHFEGGLLGRWRRLTAALAERRAEGSKIEKGALHPIVSALRPGRPSHRVNQPLKERHIRPLLERALSELDRPDCLDLFCSDGYYSCVLAQLDRSARVLGIDVDELEIRRACTAARMLGLIDGSGTPSRPRVEFRARVVDDAIESAIRNQHSYDLVLCLGGLYHLSSPRSLLQRLRSIGRRWLLVQSVVSLECEDADYFISPAPRWNHGSRFSHSRLAGWLKETGWTIVQQPRNELLGNRRASDRGSSYFLCRRS